VNTGPNTLDLVCDPALSSHTSPQASLRAIPTPFSVQFMSQSTLNAEQLTLSTKKMRTKYRLALALALNTKKCKKNNA